MPVHSRRRGRPHYFIRRVGAVVLLLIVVVTALVGVSLVGALRTPGNQSFNAKWADWLRGHHMATLANDIETYYYQPPRPQRGGQPAHLNAVPTPAKPAPVKRTIVRGAPPAAPAPVPLVVSPGLCRARASGAPADVAGARHPGHVRGPVPGRHRLHQPDHLGGVDRPHPAAGRAGARRPGAGRDLAPAARHLGAPPSPRRRPPSTAASGCRTPTAASTSTAASRAAAGRGGVVGHLRRRAGQLSAPGAARSP